jgi:hypothetical protein
LLKARSVVVRTFPAAPNCSSTAASVSSSGASVAERGGTVSRIDPRTGQVQTIGVGGTPNGIAIGQGVVWVLEGPSAALVPIEATTNTVGTPIKIQSAMTGIAYGDGSVWVAGSRFPDGVVDRIDPVTRTVTGRAVFPANETFGFALSPTLVSLAVGDRSVWATDSGLIFKVTSGAAGSLPSSVETLTSQRFAYVPGGGPGVPPLTGSTLDPVAAGASTVWVAGLKTETLYRIASATGDVTARLRLSARPTGVAVSTDRVWVSFTNGTVSAVDGRSARVVATYRVGGSPVGIAIGPNGTPWVAAVPAVQRA